MTEPSGDKTTGLGTGLPAASVPKAALAVTVDSAVHRTTATFQGELAKEIAKVLGYEGIDDTWVVAITGKRENPQVIVDPTCQVNG